MAEWISSFLKKHPNLSEFLKQKLLSFNAQYLIKVADYSVYEANDRKRDLSPLTKRNLTYHRDYGKDNRILRNCTFPLQTIWKGTQFRFASNDAYLFFLKCTLKIVIIHTNDTTEKITKKVSKVLKYYNSTPIENFESPLFILLKTDITVINAPKHGRLVRDAFNKVTEAILSFPFTDRNIASSLMKTSSVASAFIFSPSIHLIVANQEEWITTSLKHGGSTPSIQQSGEIFGTLLSDPKLFYEATNQEKGLVLEPVIIESQSSCCSIKSKLYEGPFGKFKSIDKHSFFPVVKIVGEALVKMVDGLLELGIDKKDKDTEIEDVIECSTGRLNAFFQKLLEFKGDYIRFGNTCDLIIEEIILLLSLLKPYSDGSLEQIYCDAVYPSIPKPNLIRFTQSGTQCLMEVLRTIIKLNKKMGRPTEVLYFDDIYFENRDFISHLNDKGRITGTLFTTENSTDEQFSAFKKLGKKFNALFIDFHSSAKENRSLQFSHDIISVIERLISNDLASKDLIVCIDVTIESKSNNEIKVLLEHFSDLNKAGLLHFFIFKSVHKLDNLGCDKLMAGNYLFYCHRETFLYQEFANTTSFISRESIEYQILAHFYTCAAQQIREYGAKIISNAQLFYSSLDSRFIGKDKNKFWITRRMDSESTFIEINSLDYRRGEMIYNSLASPNYMQSRDSFGYRETAVLRVGNRDEEWKRLTIRITPGIEESEVIEAQAKDLNRILEMALE